MQKTNTYYLTDNLCTLFLYHNRTKNSYFYVYKNSDLSTSFIISMTFDVASQPVSKDCMFLLLSITNSTYE